MTATMEPTLEDHIQARFQEADQLGLQRPGRKKLTKLIGASEHQIRQALARINTSPIPDATPVPRVENAEPPQGAPAPAPERPAPWTGGESGDAFTQHPAPTATAPVNAGEPPKPWPLILIAAAAAVVVWGGWVELGKLTGFGLVQPLPGLADSVWINTAIALPIGIEAYGGYALRTWLSSANLSTRTRAFARWSAVSSLVIGAGAQVASHLMRADGVHTAPPVVTVLVSCVPVLVLGLATGLATLVRRDSRGGQ